MAKTKSAKKPAFEDRVRFNWGFHDGACDAAGPLGHREMHLKGEQNPKRVSREFDAAYYEGYLAGVLASKNGEYKGESTGAWETFKTSDRTAGVDTTYPG